jgi:hypothetical protein
MEEKSEAAPVKLTNEEFDIDTISIAGDVGVCCMCRTAGGKYSILHIETVALMPICGKCVAGVKTGKIVNNPLLSPTTVVQVGAVGTVTAEAVKSEENPHNFDFDTVVLHLSCAFSSQRCDKCGLVIEKGLGTYVKRMTLQTGKEIQMCVDCFDNRWVPKFKNTKICYPDEQGKLLTQNEFKTRYEIDAFYDLKRKVPRMRVTRERQAEIDLKCQQLNYFPQQASPGISPQGSAEQGKNAFVDGLKSGAGSQIGQIAVQSALSCCVVA